MYSTYIGVIQYRMNMCGKHVDEYIVCLLHYPKHYMPHENRKAGRSIDIEEILI